MQMQATLPSRFEDWRGYDFAMSSRVEKNRKTAYSNKRDGVMYVCMSQA